MINKNTNGFSLIELSIVLIIISLLIAGILGGTSLIRSAKITSIISQWRDWEISINAFKIVRDRLPGDVNDNGQIGYIQNDGVLYSATGDVCDSCGYYTGDYASKKVGTVAGPWVDLYLAKLSMFKPNPASADLGTVIYPLKRQINVILPPSKIGNSIVVYFNQNSSEYKNPYIENRDTNEDLEAKFLYEIDKKIDDGLWKTGKIASECDNSVTDKTYNTFINEKTPCSMINYALK